MDKLQEFIDGDDKAFGWLVNQNKERIYRVVWRIVKNEEEAKDLAQEAFVKAYRNRRSFKAQSGFYTWVYRIAVNLALNYINRNRHRQAKSIEDANPPEFAVTQPSELEQAELNRVISSAVAKLPPRQKTIFILRHYEEMQFAEIGETLSITTGAAKANYHKAIQKLKSSLGPYIREGRLAT